MKHYLEELRRRNVFRAIAAYIIIGWVLLQVATTLEEALGLPTWFDAVITALLVIGFPAVVIVSWVYELTPDGLQKTRAVDAEASIASRTGRRLNYITIAGVVVLLAVVVFDRVAMDGGSGVPAAAGEAAAAGDSASGVANVAAEPERSIAVLPFVAMTSSEDDEFFADGLSEEILNVLANIKELKVAGRTSSFYYKGRNKDLREIADALGVAHILEGSVRRSGNRLRVTAQLIKADDGFHLWSQSFDREDGDTFKIQDEISRNVAHALSTEILGAADAGPAEGNVEAENFYLIAQAALAQRSLSDVRRARDLYARAAVLSPKDPRYLSGYAQSVALQFWNFRDISSDEAIAEASTAIGTALELETPTADTLAIAGLVEELKALALNDAAAKARALDYYNQAVSIDPDNILALQWLASIYLDINEPKKSLDRFQQVVELDPLNELALTGLANSLSGLGRFEEAKKHLFRMQALFPQTGNATRYLAGLEYASGRLDKAAFWSARAVKADPSPLEIIFLVRNYTGLGWADKALDAAEAYRESRDGVDISRLVQAQLDKDFQAMAAEAEALFGEYGETPFAVMSAWASAKAGHCDRAIVLLEQQFPSLQGEVLEYVEAGDLMHATLLAHCHAVSGNAAEAERLASLILASDILTDPDLGIFGFDILILSAAHAVRGDVEAAIEMLGKIPPDRMALAGNPLTVTVDESPVFTNLYDEPAFQDYARRERYEIARQARLLAAGETEQEVVSAVQDAGYSLSGI